MSSNKFLIRCRNHSNKQVHAIGDFMKENKFTDVMLVAAGGILRAHRVILAASSSYFYNLFLSESSDMKMSQMCLVDNISYVDLYNIVRYIYVGELAIDYDYLNHFIEIGDMLGVKGIHELDIDIVNPNGITVHNVLNTKIKQEAVEVPKTVEIAIPGPSKKPIILKNSTKITKLRVKRPSKELLVPIPEPSITVNEIFNQLNLVPYKKPQTQVEAKTQIKKEPKRLVIKLPRSARRCKTIGPQTLDCQYCCRPFNAISTRRNHEKFCIANPNRSISICNICNEEVKPGSLTFHKKRYHGYVTKPRRKTIDVKMPIDEI